MSQENKHEKLDPEQEQTVLDQEEAQKAQPEPTGEPKPEEPKPEKTEPQLLQEKVDELNDRLLRTMAEYDNFRKRSQKERRPSTRRQLRRRWRSLSRSWIPSTAPSPPPVRTRSSKRGLR